MSIQFPNLVIFGILTFHFLPQIQFMYRLKLMAKLKGNLAANTYTNTHIQRPCVHRDGRHCALKMKEAGINLLISIR